MNKTVKIKIALLYIAIMLFVYIILKFILTKKNKSLKEYETFNNNTIKIYVDLKNKIKNNKSVNSFFDYFKKNRNIDSFEYNNLLNDTYVILNHNEYILKKFFEDVINFTEEIKYKNKLLKFVNEEHDSDIKIYNLTRQGFSILNMKNNKTYKFGIENDIPIPYFTGLYSKKNIEINNKRKYLLGYIGGTWRGERNVGGIPKRKIVIDKLKEINNKNKNELFYSPTIAKTHKHEKKLGWSKGEFGSLFFSGFFLV